MKWLAVGKTFIAPKPARNPFRVSGLGTLPKFGPAVTASAGAAKKGSVLNGSAAPQFVERVPTGALEPACGSAARLQPEPEVSKLPVSFVGRAGPHPVEGQPKEAANKTERPFTDRPVADYPPGPSAQAANLSGLSRSGGTVSVSGEKRLLFSFLPAGHHAAGVARAAASLDEVKVIRNDLSDADVEVVPAEIKTAAAPPPRSAVEAEPVGWTLWDWQRLASRLKVFGRAGA